MKDLIEKIETKLLKIEAGGWHDRGAQLSDERDWHETRQLVAQLKSRVALLNANPDMSHGLRPAPDAAKLSN